MKKAHFELLFTFLIILQSQMVVKTEGSQCIEDECKSFCIEEGFQEGRCLINTCYCSSWQVIFELAQCFSGS
ncbi:unnamed protein product [Lathyrus oleraceus]